MPGAALEHVFRVPEQAISLAAIGVPGERRGCRSHGELSEQAAAV